MEVTKKLDGFGHETAPSGLIARAESRTIVAVEVFVEQNVIAPMRVGLKLLGTSVYRTATQVVAQKGRVKPTTDLLLTSKRFIIFPDPVGHSILKLSP